MSLCYNFSKWTMITLAAAAISLTIGLVSLAYGQENKVIDKQDIRQFLELGEEKYREECYKDTPHNKVLDDTMNDLLDYMPDNIRKDVCEGMINEIKNQTLGSIVEGDK